MALVPMFSAAAEEAKGSPARAELAKRTDANPSAKNFRAEVKCEAKQIDARIDTGAQRRL